MIAPTLPTPEAMRSQLERLASNPGSVILIAIESLESQNFPRVTFGWFDKDERKALRAALTKCRKKREQALHPSDQSRSAGGGTACKGDGVTQPEGDS